MKLLDYCINLPTQATPFRLLPFGCMHEDDPGFRRSLWEQCVDDILQPHTYAIGLGDYSNLLRTTARKHLKSYTADNNSFEDLDTLVHRDKIRFFKECKFDKIAPRLIGLAPGNHLWEFQDGTNDTQFLCQLAKVPYLDKPGMIRLRVKAHDKVMGTLKILVHHGDWSGGSSRTGGDITAAENKALGFDFDIYMFSHTHRLWAMHVPTITIPTDGELRPIERPRVFMRTGCFLAGYDGKCVQGKTDAERDVRRSYAQDKLLNPTALGYPTLEVKYERSNGDKNYRPRFTVRY